MDRITITLVLVSAVTIVCTITLGIYFSRIIKKVNRRYGQIFEDLIAENLTPMRLRRRPLGMPSYLEITIENIRCRVETRQQIRFVADFARSSAFRMNVYPNSPFFNALGLERVKLDPELGQHYRIYAERPTFVRQQLARGLRTTLIEGREYLAYLTLGKKRLVIGFRLYQKQLRKNIWLQLTKPERTIDAQEMKSSVRWAISMVKELQRCLSTP